MRMLQLVLVALAVGALSTTAEAQGVPVATEVCELPHATGDAQARLESGQRDRAYRLFVPTSYDGGTRLSLVLDLHGSGGSPAGQARTSGFEAVAEREGSRWRCYRLRVPSGMFLSATTAQMTLPTLPMSSIMWLLACASTLRVSTSRVSLVADV